MLSDVIGDFEVYFDLSVMAVLLWAPLWLTYQLLRFFCCSMRRSEDGKDGQHRSLGINLEFVPRVCSPVIDSKNLNESHSFDDTQAENDRLLRFFAEERRAVLEERNPPMIGNRRVAIRSNNLLFKVDGRYYKNDDVLQVFDGDFNLEDDDYEDAEEEGEEEDCEESSIPFEYSSSDLTYDDWVDEDIESDSTMRGKSQSQFQQLRRSSPLNTSAKRCVSRRRLSPSTRVSLKVRSRGGIKGPKKGKTVSEGNNTTSIYAQSNSRFLESLDSSMRTNGDRSHKETSFGGCRYDGEGCDYGDSDDGLPSDTQRLHYRNSKEVDSSGGDDKLPRDKVSQQRMD